MNQWRKSLFNKYIAWLILCLMVINPVQALQYIQPAQATVFSNIIPGYLPKAIHIHASQKDNVVALLARQGYDIIPASHDEARQYLARNANANDTPVHDEADPNLEKLPAEDCDKNKTEDKKTDCTRKTEPEPEPEPEKTPASRTTIFHGQGLDLPNLGSGSGGNGDTAAVMFIVIGIVVVAALFIYAGKFIADLINNDDDYYSYWWDIGTQFINLDTENNQHGNFGGLKFSAGFIAARLAQLGLSIEIGKMDLDLLYNRNSIPQRINLQGTYWFIGPTVRWLLGNIDNEQTINNSYVYFELLGGGTDRSEIDITAIARVGINTGIGEHMRIGIHYGAFYLGLDEDQGFANDGDNYWNTYGIELGYQF